MSTLRFAHVDSGTLYSPVSLQVLSHAGLTLIDAKLEFDGGSTSTALAGLIDESQDDIIAAVVEGQLAEIQGFEYTPDGTKKLKHLRYTSIASSLDLSSSDSETFFYSANGELVRTQLADGTIFRNVHSETSQESGVYVGTNDFGWEGGSATGPEDMSLATGTSIDSGQQGGNRNITGYTEYPDDQDTSLARQTTYSVDLMGRVIARNNPVGPHEFIKRDNLGRPQAVGYYSTLANIHVEADDPALQSTDRVALFLLDWDEAGRIVRRRMQRIDPTDGSILPGELLHERWFDGNGRVVKEDADHLRKLSYDTVGRLVGEYYLASHDDASYQDALTVDGDIVVEENRAAYDQRGLLVMAARIERNQDDYGSGRDRRGSLLSSLSTCCSTRSTLKARPT